MTRDRKKLFALVLAPILIAGLYLLGGGYYSGAGSGKLCSNCHVISPSVDSLSYSSHQQVPCTDCHGSAFTFDLSKHATHWNRMYRILTDTVPERIQLKDKHLDNLMQSCKSCHRNIYARWTMGGHSLHYSDVFLNTEHNSSVRLNEDCLRCHGMFFEGSVHEIVEPVSLQGPWLLLDADLGERPAIPCLTCHNIHHQGQPAYSPTYSNPKFISHNRVDRTSTLAFFDRREQMYFDQLALPLPEIVHDGGEVKLSNDRRQGVCYQCHAPDWTKETGSGDDRTPVGVHEGIGCLGCHSPHSLDARRSCDTCHPRMSNCGLNVGEMDTSYLTPTSAHDIHFVACQDCHPDASKISRFTTD